LANPFLVLGGIAVGVITAAFGLMQVPGWIAGAQNAAAANDLAAIRTAQAASMNLNGTYFDDIATLYNGSLGLQFKPSGGVEFIGLAASDDAWCATVKSASGIFFAASSKKTAVGSGETREDADVAAGCPGAEPLELAAAAEHSLDQYLPYSSTVAASGGTAPYTYAVVGGALPEGLTIETTESGDAVLAGATGFTGTHTATLEVTDAKGRTAQATVTITVDPNPAVNPAGSLTVGSFASDMVFSNDSQRAYIVSRLGKSVSFVDTKTSTIIATVPTAGTPSGIAVSPDGRHIAVTEYNAKRVWIFDTASGELVTTVTLAGNNIYTGTAWSPDGSYLYVIRKSGTTNVMDFITPATWTVADTMGINSVTTTGLTIDSVLPDGRLLMTFSAARTVVVDPNARTATEALYVAKGGVSAAYAGGGRIWRADGPSTGDSTLFAYEIGGAATPTSSHLLGPLGVVRSIAPSLDGRWLYWLTTLDGGTLHVVDTKEKTVVTSLPAPISSSGSKVKMSGDGTKVYVIGGNDGIGTVTVFTAAGA